MQKSDRDDALILIGTGIVLGIALIFIVMRKDQTARAQAQPAPQPQQLPPTPNQSYKQDTEFIKWYTETIIKPSIQQAARESAQNAIRQFMEANPRTEMQTLESKTTKPRAKPGNWMITRDSEGAIMSIEAVKDTPQKEPQSIKPTISLRLPEDRINISKEHISK